MLKVAIIGAGPAGLLAAYGAHTEGARVQIFDVRPRYRPDTIFSLQYLHEPCGLDLVIRSMTLRYAVDAFTTGVTNMDGVRRAAREAYNLKLGRGISEENSTRFLFEPSVRVWSLKDAYRTLWRLFAPSIEQRAIDWYYLTERLPKHHDVVISTAPLPRLRPDLNWPLRTGLIAMDWLPMPMEEDTCVYNLDLAVPWYRATSLDGGVATEFVQLSRWTDEDIRIYGTAKIQGLRKVVQHSNILGPMPENLWLTGRWGSWDPTRLTHHAYRDGKEAVRIAKGSIRQAE